VLFNNEMLHHFQLCIGLSDLRDERDQWQAVMNRGMNLQAG
jgi:hypothetical protein